MIIHQVVLSYLQQVQDTWIIIYSV